MAPFAQQKGINLYKSSVIYLIGVLITITCIVILSVFAQRSIDAQSQLVEMLYTHPFTVSTNVLEADANLVAMHRYMKDVVISRDSESLQVAVDLVSQHESRVLNHLSKAKSEFLGSKERFQQVINAVIAWREIRTEVIVLTQKQDYGRAADITINKGADYVKKLNSEMAGLVEFARNKAAEFRTESRQQKARIQGIQLLVSSVVCALVLVTFTLMFRQLRKSEKSILDSEHRFRSIFNGVPVSIWDEDYTQVYARLEQLRAEGISDLRQYLQSHPKEVEDLAQQIRVVQVNEESLNIFSAQTEEELLPSIANTFGHGALEVFAESLCAIWDKQDVFVAKAQYRSLDNRQIVGQISVPIPKTLHEAAFVPVVIEDITKKEHNDNQLRLLASVFTESREGICIVSPESKIVEVNQAFTEITGYSRAESLGENPKFLKSGKHDNHFYKAMWDTLLDTGSWQGEIWNKRKNGQIYPQMLTISSVKNGQNKLLNYIGLFSDISGLKAHEAELNHLAHFDMLTDLPNRVLFADRLNHAMAETRRTGDVLAVAYIDLDGFKAVNDTYGHDVGDALLVEVAHRMKASLREVDTLARIGGDEFVIIFYDIKHLEDLQKLLNRLLVETSSPFQINDIDIKISVSIGVTLFEHNQAVEADQLQRQADQAMYEAKLAGRNRYRFFDPQTDSAISKKFALLAEIERAIKDDEFLLYFQPKLNMQTGEIHGAEALLRWQHPERGLLTPAEFLPQIVNDNISVKLGEWVLRNTLNQIQKWQKAGLSTVISVNVGAIQLQQSDFVNSLRHILSDFPDVPTETLQLEILETSALEDFDGVANVIRQCQSFGVEFALDDFGSGYSSLIYLKKLPVKTMKIDQEFVLSILNNHDDQTILQGLLQLAERFNMQALAEGVETLAHVELLLALGCQYGQGYAISKPISADDFYVWYTGWQPCISWFQKAS